MEDSKEKEKPFFPHGNIIVIIIFFLIFIGLIVLIVQAYTVRVHPSTCPKIKATYAVNPGLSGNIIKQCGNGSEQCSFDNIPNVTEAIHQCDIRGNICSLFSYNPSSRTMNIIDGSKELIKSNTEDLYLRQT